MGLAVVIIAVYRGPAASYIGSFVKSDDDEQFGDLQPIGTDEAVWSCKLPGRDKNTPHRAAYKSWT